MRIQKKRIFTLGVTAIVLLAAVVRIAWGNTTPELNRLAISCEQLPQGFDGYRIAHISDLHNAELGTENARLIGLLQAAEPDMIAITGDLVDSRNTDIDVALRFIEAAVKIAPCYYVTGNHEARISEYDALRAGMIERGVVVLEDQGIDIERDGSKITLLGVHDPSFQTDYLFGDAENVMKSKLREMSGGERNFTVLLSHRPELFEVYAEYHLNLVLSGHAHGGQFRLPIVGGMIAPNQGLFPKYDAGLYNHEKTNMVVSRGIGNSIFPFRVNNRPEVILIELQRSPKP